MNNIGKPCLVVVHEDANEFYTLGDPSFKKLTFPEKTCCGIVYNEDDEHLTLKSFRGISNSSIRYGFIDRFVKEDIDWFYLDDALNFSLKGKEI